MSVERDDAMSPWSSLSSAKTTGDLLLIGLEPVFGQRQVPNNNNNNNNSTGRRTRRASSR